MENLKVDLVDIPFDVIDKSMYHFNGYFNKGIFAKAKIKDHASKEDFFYWHKYVITVPKLVWLTNEFLKNNRFDFPVTAKWIAKEGKWSIHPGHFRKTIIEWFDNNSTIECFCSDPHNFKIKKTFNTVADIKNFYNVPVEIRKGYEVHSTVKEEITRLYPWHKRCQDFFSTTKIDANFDLSNFGYNENNILQTIKRHIKVKASTEIEQNRAILLMPLFANYNHYGVTIEST